MEKFYAGQVRKLITTVRSGCDVEIEEQLLFCENWGGALALAAQVALAWTVERREWQQGGATKAAEIPAAFEMQQEQQLELTVEPAAPPRPSPSWVKAALTKRAG